MTTIEQAKCTLGNVQGYNSHEIIDGKYVEFSHRISTIRVLTILQAAGEAVITHTGGYGRKKFILNGIEFTTESGIRNGEKAIAIGTDSTCINYTDVVFDREDWEYLHKSFIHRGSEKKNQFWLGMSEVGPGE